MSERRYEKLWPGSVIRMMLEIRHAPLRLRNAGAVLRHEERRSSSCTLPANPPGARWPSRLAALVSRA
jgi:hypothetical protein